MHDGVATYRKGKGCAFLNETEMAIREDVMESQLPTCQIDEDEEKFFDRISTDVIMASMALAGFLKQGYMELKGPAMIDRAVNIITNKGLVDATFNCGVEQSNPDSPKTSNLIILLKHRIWKSYCPDPLSCSPYAQRPFQFNTTDDRDGGVEVGRLGYCDDNTR